MLNKKRGFHRKRENFFRSKLVLNSLRSKTAFSLSVDGIIDQNELNSYIQKYYLEDVNVNQISNAIFEHLNGCG